MIYIDTGAFRGRYLARDQHHDQAYAGWKLLAERRERCATSNFVLDEIFTLLGRRASYGFTAEVIFERALRSGQRNGNGMFRRYGCPRPIRWLFLALRATILLNRKV